MFRVKAYMRRQIFRLAWPVVMEMFGIMMVSVLTTAMVGSLGAVSLGAVGLATMVQGSSTMIFASAGTGAVAIIARDAGAGNWERVRVVAGQTVLLGIVFGAAIGVAGSLASAPALKLIGADPAVAALTGDLLGIMFLFSPFLLVMNIGNAILRGMGDTRMPFLITTFSNIVAVVLNYLLIFGVGLPELGPYGAAWGCAVSQLVGALTVVAVLAVHRRIRLNPQLVFRYRPEAVAAILAVSIPAGGEQLALQSGRIVFTFMLASVGAVQFAAHQVALQAESISFMPGFGLSVAVMTLTGVNLGRGLPHRAVQYVWETNKIAIWGMTVMGIALVIFARPLTAMFIQDPAVVEWGAACVMIAALEQPTIAITYALGGALRGAGDTRWPMYVTTIGVWVVRMPLIYIFIVLLKCDITIAWYITAGDFLLRSIVLWQRFAGRKWQTIKSF